MAKDSKSKALGTKKQETHAQMMKRTKDMNWFDAGKERGVWQHQKLHGAKSAKKFSKGWETSKDYDKKIAIAKSYD